MILARIFRFGGHSIRQGRRLQDLCRRYLERRFMLYLERHRARDKAFFGGGIVQAAGVVLIRAGRTDWDDYLDNLIDHDKLTEFAMSLLRSGMSDGAAVNLLRAQVERLQGVDPDRKQRRLDEIPGMVSSARAKIKEPEPQPASTLGDFDVSEVIEAEGIPEPRPWLLGNQFCRGFVSCLFADGGVGKTSLRILQFISMAIGRSLCSQHVFCRCRVLLISLEDDKKEVLRRIIAVMQHYGVETAELKGWMRVACPVGKRLLQRNGRFERKAGALEREIRDAIACFKPDVVGIDPFVKLHDLSENDATDMNAVCDVLVHIATTENIGVDVPHHVHKGQSDPGDANAGRGSSSIKDAGRLNYTLSVMDKNCAKDFDIGPEDRFSYVRLDRAKVNITERSGKPEWFKIVGKNISNATDLYPAGDTIQVVVPWKAPEAAAMRRLSYKTLNLILDAIDRGVTNDKGPTGERYSGHPNAKGRAAWKAAQIVAAMEADITEDEARALIKAWLNSGTLYEKEYVGRDRHEAQGLFVDASKRPGVEDERAHL